MSVTPSKTEFEDYNTTSANYDGGRQAVGVDILMDIIKAGGADTSKMRILDAGCGTGNYLSSLVTHGCPGHLEGVELNPGMLGEARAKKTLSGVKLQQGSLLGGLPFPDGSLDVVITTQVIHHLEEPHTDSFPGLRMAMREVARVLKGNGGRWVVNLTSPRQTVEAFWWARVVPERVATYTTRQIDPETLREICGEEGSVFRFENTEGKDVFKCTEPLVESGVYLDIDGPKRKEWRDLDSVFANLTDDEVERISKEIDRIKENGEVESMFEQYEKKREEIGQSSWVVLTKL